MTGVPTSSLRIGVIGVGQRAPLATLATDCGARVVACADPNPAGRQYARELFGDDVRILADYRHLLTEPLDAVMVLTPDHLHTAPVVDALAAGIAVFVEKPLALSIEDCDLILHTARATGSRLYVGHNLRHLPTARAMNTLIQQGAIGQVKAIWCRHFVGHGGDYYFKDWHADRRNTLGLLLQKAAHDLDVIHWLAGGYSRLVVALGALAVYGANPHRRSHEDSTDGRRMTDWFDPTAWPPSALRDLNPVVDVEDLSMMLAELDNGVLASYEQCHFTPDYWRNYTVIGDEGRLENFGDGIDGDPATIQVWNRRRSGYRRDADLTVAVEAQQDGLHGGADAALVAEFLRFAAAGGPTDTSPVAAREAVAAGVAATTSLRDGGRPVNVTELDPPVGDYFRAQQTGPGRQLTDSHTQPQPMPRTR